MRDTEREYGTMPNRSKQSELHIPIAVKNGMAGAALVAGMLFQKELIAAGVRGTKKVVDKLGDALDPSKSLP